MAGLNVDLVSTDRKVWSGMARAVSAPSVDGQIGILPGHTPILAVLRPGTVRVTVDEGVEPFEVYVTGGFVSVDDDLVTVVADAITPVPGSEG